MRIALLVLGLVVGCHHVGSPGTRTDAPSPMARDAAVPESPAADLPRTPAAPTTARTVDEAGAPRACPPRDAAPSPRESAWLARVAPDIEFGKTTPRQLHTKLGRPQRSYAQGDDVTVHLYPGAALTQDRKAGQRYFYERGGVIVALSVGDVERIVRRDSVRAGLSEFSFQTQHLGPTTFDFICGVGGRADVGLFFWYNPDGVLMEASLGNWKTWTIRPNPCEDVCSEPH